MNHAENVENQLMEIDEVTYIYNEDGTITALVSEMDFVTFTYNIDGTITASPLEQNQQITDEERQRREDLLDRQVNEHLEYEQQYQEYYINMAEEEQNLMFTHIYNQTVNNNIPLNEWMIYEDWDEVDDYIRDYVKRYVKFLLQNNLWPRYFWFQNFESLQTFRVRVANLFHQYNNYH